MYWKALSKFCILVGSGRLMSYPGVFADDLLEFCTSYGEKIHGWVFTGTICYALC